MGGIMVMIYISKHIKKCRLVNYVGRNSLVYYGLLDIMSFVPDILVYNILHINLEKLGTWNIGVWLAYAILICILID